MSISITYQALVDRIENEGIVNLKDVSIVINDLDIDWDEEDDSNNSSWEKARFLAEKVKNPALAIRGDSDDYHNLSVDYVRRNWYDFAIWILLRGLKENPYSLDLLADTILYGTESGQRDVSKLAYDKLMRIDRKEWRWRAYSFTIDYYLDKADTVPKGKSRDSLKESAKRLADDFVEYATVRDKSNIDRAYCKKAFVFKKIAGNNENTTYEEILKQGFTAVKRAPQCSLALADYEYDCGEYQSAVDYLKECINASHSPQPEVNLSYVYLLRGLAKTSKLFSEYSDEDFSDKESEVKKIYKDFHTAIAQKDIRSIYQEAANRVIKILETQTGVKDDFENSDGDEFI